MTPQPDQLDTTSPAETPAETLLTRLDALHAQARDLRARLVALQRAHDAAQAQGDRFTARRLGAILATASAETVAATRAINQVFAAAPEPYRSAYLWGGAQERQRRHERARFTSRAAPSSAPSSAHATSHPAGVESERIGRGV